MTYAELTALCENARESTENYDAGKLHPEVCDCLFSFRSAANRLRNAIRPDLALELDISTDRTEAARLLGDTGRHRHELAKALEDHERTR